MRNGSPTEQTSGPCRSVAMSSTASDRQAAACWGAARSRREWASGAVSSAPTTTPPSSTRSTATSPAASSNTSCAGPGGRRAPTPGQDDRRPDVGMTGERHLYARREDPDVGRVGRVGRRQDERGLGVAELVGDGLHLARREALGIEDDTERVAGERMVGEHVGGHVSAGHRRGVSLLRKPMMASHGRFGGARIGPRASSMRAGEQSPPNGVHAPERYASGLGVSVSDRL